MGNIGLVPFKIVLACILSLSSYLIVAFSNSMAMSLFGIVAASLSSGIGDVSFLSMTAFFHSNCVSAWSSGTGAAGLIGAFVYAALTTVISPEHTMLVVTVIPFILLLVYFFLLDRPNHPKFHLRCNCCASSTDQSIYASLKEANEARVMQSRASPDSGYDNPVVLTAQNSDPDLSNAHIRDGASAIQVFPASSSSGSSDSDSVDTIDLEQVHPTFAIKLIILKQLGGLLFFLAAVYFFEYMINQSLFEMLIFENSISPSEQYRWYQVVYQLGVFLSRSSVNVVQLRWTWIMALLQSINFIFCLTQVLYGYIPHIAIMFIIILYEGLLGGLAYVNTFFRIIKEVTPIHREYAMASAAISDSVGIMLAGFLAIPLRNWLCNR